MTFGEKVHTSHIEPRLLSARLQYFKPKIITGNVTKAETNISFGLKFQIGEGILVCQIQSGFFATFVALSEYMNFTRLDDILLVLKVPQSSHVTQGRRQPIYNYKSAPLDRRRKPTCTKTPK